MPTAEQVISKDLGRILVEAVPDLVCLCRDGRVVHVNSAGARLLGLAAPAVMTGRPFVDFVHADFQEIFADGLEELAAENDTLPLIFNRGAGTVEVELSVRVLDNGLVALHGRDITERTHAVEVLLKSEERYRRLVELALDFTCICTGGLLRFVNAAGVRLLGVTAAADLSDRPLLDIVHPADRFLLADGLGALVGRPEPVPMRFLREDGAVVEAETVVLPLGMGDDCSFMMEARDVTALKRSAETLREREQKLQGIMDTVADGIVTADETGTIQSINPAAQRIFGYEAAEALGGNLAMLMPEPYASGHDGYMRAYLGGGSPKILGIGREVEGRRKDGSAFPLELNVAELKRGDQRLFIGVTRDITRRKAAQEALRRARDELEIRVEERTRELHHVSHRLGQILNSASEGILGLGQDGRITFANPTAAAILDLPVEHLVGVEAHRLAGRLRIAQGTSGRRLPVRAALMRGAVAARAELTLERPGAAPLSLEFAGAPVEENGILVGMVAVFRDITERKRSEEKLRLAATVFGTTAEAILVLGPDRAVQAANPAFAQITGHCAEEVMGRAPTFLDGEEGMTAIWEAVETDGRWQGERWNHRKNGERYAERFAITTVIDDQGLVAQYVVVFSDITQRKLDEERIRYQANYDALTGLPNRALFQDRLHTMVSAAQRTGDMLGLMFIDLDGFKLVNDTLGHDMGDELLKEAARRLSECVRSGDTVARLGGDEFTVLMPHLQDFRNAPIAAQRIIDTLEQPFDLGGKEAFVSASIGIATFPNDATDSQTLLKHADAAMYRAKEQGKANFQFYTADMNAEVTERLVIKNGLSKALEREEFTLYYQPKIDLRQNRMVGVEALLRWRNAELGPVSPAKFIPVMEETGLITPVGEWAIETACHQYREWTEVGLPIRIAVNLSVRQLRQGGLAKTVSDLLSRAGIPPSGLELEITESMIMKDTENAVATLRELDEMGIHLAMDDFGTGYSSLSYLKRFPLHTIKIDRSFISDIATDQDDLEIIRTIISMGHSLRRRIVAEGVETKEQRELLAGLDCDEIQGYLVSPPVPAPELIRLFREGKLV